MTEWNIPSCMCFEERITQNEYKISPLARKTSDAATPNAA